MINEPEKCSELVWCDLNSLPDDMIEYEKIEEDILKHIKIFV